MRSKSKKERLAAKKAPGVVKDKAENAAAAVVAAPAPTKPLLWLNRLFKLQPICSKLPTQEVLALAQELVGAQCRAEAALWIAIKFLGLRRKRPKASLMAEAVGLPMDTLTRWEVEDLQRIDWDIVPLARKCGLLEPLSLLQESRD